MRELTVPQIGYNDGLRPVADKKWKATWNLEGISKFSSVGTGGKGLLQVNKDLLPELCSITLGKSEDYAFKGPFLKELKEALRGYGFMATELGDLHPSIELKPESNAEIRRMYIAKQLSDAYTELVDKQKKPGTELKLILILLPNDDATLFADVKWWSDCVQGVHTVCIKAEKLKKGMIGSKGGKVDNKLLANVW